MWTRYVHMNGDDIARYLKVLAKDKESHSDAYILLKDILVLSNRLGFQILNN